MTIDSRAIVVTPYHRAANRLREELRGADRHGSCGLGIGETWGDYLQKESIIVCGELADTAAVLEKLRAIRERKLQQFAGCGVRLRDSCWPDFEMLLEDSFPGKYAEDYAYFASQVQTVNGGEFLVDRLSMPGTVLFEGAQGVLLDEDFGSAPYNTWSKTTFSNALALLQSSHYAGRVYQLGVLRAYATRHGAGPFVTEDSALDAKFPESHNCEGPWQGKFRRGYFDLPALRHALRCCGRVDGLAVTHLDRLSSREIWPICDAYQQGGRRTWMPEFSAEALFASQSVYGMHWESKEFSERLEQETGIPVVLESYGPSTAGKRLLDYKARLL